MKFRLAAYTPFTSEKWILPKPLSYSVVYILNSLHSLEFNYPDSQNGSDVITPDKGYPYEYAVEYFNPATETWDEPLGSRFIGMKVSGDQMDEMPTKKYSNLSLKWLFRKAKVWGAGGVADSDERVFKDVTVGSILIALFTEAYERGIKITNPANIGFTDKVDSSGTSWGGTVSMAFPINMSLEEVLNDLTEQGFIDWDMQGRRTLVWKADSSTGLARDKRSVYLQNVTGTTSAPEEVSFESMMTTARVLGETQSWEFSNKLSSPWGRLEDVVSQSGVIDPITAKEASEKILLEGERPIKTHTKELTGYSNLQPLIDVRVGDWVRGQTNRDRTKPTSFEDMRIQEISLEVTGSDYTWNVAMGDRRSDMLEKIARRQTALSGGSSSGTSRTPGGGTAQTGDWRVPTTPTTFTVRIKSHLDADTSRYKGRAMFTWFDDHMGLDKYDNSLSPQARRGYEVSYREAGTTDWTTLAWYGPDADKYPQSYYPLDVINPVTNRPYTYEFRLRTLGAETYSPYTTAVAVQMIADQDAPEKPTKPLTEASLGVITVSWDKKTLSGKAMPLDFSHLIVESRHYADTEVIKEVGQIYGNSLPLVGLTEGVPYQFRFVAVDTAGNRSTPSDWSVASVIQPLVDTKSIQDALSSASGALDAAVKETESRLADLNKYMNESFGEFTDDMQSVWSAINSPDVFAQAEAPKDPKAGQLWIDTDNSNIMSLWDGNSWVQLRDGAIQQLQRALEKKSTTYFSNTAPADPSYGDLWFNPSENNEVRRWDNSWVLVTDPQISSALSQAQSAKAAADGKIQTFLSPTAPVTVGLGNGDLWFDSDDGNRMYRWNATTKVWVDARDASIDEFHDWQQDLISSLEGGDYGRMSTYYQSTPPQGSMPGDLWVDTSTGGTLKIWNSATSEWDPVTDPTLSDAVNSMASDVDALQDSVIQTYVQVNPPVSTDSRKLSVGDLWFDSDDNNKLYRYDPFVTANAGWVAVQDKNISALQSAVASKITTYYATTAPPSPVPGDLWIDQSTGNTLKRWTNGAWVVITDADVEAALNRANDAKAIADGKVQTFFQTSAPPAAGLADGDLWFDTDDGNKMYRWDGVSATKSWVSVRDGFITSFPNWEDNFINAIRAGDYARVSTFYQTIAPASPIDGDLWMDTATGVLKRFNKSANRWDIIQDAALKRSITDLGTDIEAIQDKVINTYASPTAPTGTTSRPLAVGDLWFDSSNSNKLYRRSSSGSWDPVSDTSATEALAKTIPTVIHSTTVADSTSKAANGSTWFQHLPSITSPVAAQWTKEDGKWVPVTVSSEVIANLDVGKLTAGSASLSTAVVDKLFANIFAAKKISASELAVAPSSVFPDPLFQGSYGYKPWDVVNGGIELSGSGKQTGVYSSNLEVAVSPGDEYVLSFDKNVYPDTDRISNAAVYARYYDQGGIMTDTGKVILSHNSGDGLTKSGSWVVPDGVYKAQFGFFVQASVVEGTRIRISNPRMVRKVGGILIKDGGVTAEHVTASQSLTAKVAQFLTVKAGMIEANAVTASNIKAGSVDSTHLTARSVLAEHLNFLSEDPSSGGSMSLDSTGLRLQREGSTIFQLTNASVDTISLIGADGVNVAGMSNDGSVTGQVGTFEELNVGGMNLNTIMEEQPRGIIARAVRTSTANVNPSTSNTHLQPAMRLEFPVRGGYTYEIRAEGLGVYMNNYTGTTAIFYMYSAGNGNIAAVGGAGTSIRNTALTPIRSSESGDTPPVSMVWHFTPSSDYVASVLIAYSIWKGTEPVRINCTSSRPFTLTAREFEKVPTTGKVDFLGTVGAGNTSTENVAAPRRETQTWTASAAASWAGSAPYSDDYAGSTKDLWQGYWSGSPNARRSHINFNGLGDKGKSIASTRGKITTLEKLEVYLYNAFFYYYSGGKVRLHFHNSTTTSAFPSTTYIGDVSMGRGAGKWFEITNSTAKAAFLSGGFTGIALDPRGSTDQNYYGAFKGVDGGKYAPKIRATYLTT